MARALIVGCGCRGQAVGKFLLAKGWEVRGTSRHQEGLAAIEAAGIEPALADPGQPGTVLDLIGDITAIVWLMGSAQGEAEELAAVHGSGLERVLEKMVETPVRGFVYEAGGDVDPILISHGREIVEAAATWEIAISTILVDPADFETWHDPFGVWFESITNSVLEMANQAR
ncbi:MAG TPA: hypothetical protein VHQ43_03150 [Solirubrobacterales bacterium]|nr:hypothetical protein [Solirubrobacterales bacterium]